MATKERQSSVTKTFIVLIALIAAGLLYFFADARTSYIFPKCIFYSITGLYCPGCGSQRAFSSLLHGDVLQALNYNLLFIICLPLLLYSAVVRVINVYRNAELEQGIFYSGFFVKMLLALIMIFWIARNLPLYPFSLLAPHAV